VLLVGNLLFKREDCVVFIRNVLHQSIGPLDFLFVQLLPLFAFGFFLLLELFDFFGVSGLHIIHLHLHALGDSSEVRH